MWLIQKMAKKNLKSLIFSVLRNNSPRKTFEATQQERKRRKIKIFWQEVMVGKKKDKKKKRKIKKGKR